MGVCTFNDNGVCQRHGVRHFGKLLRIALDPSERGEKYRRDWDEFKLIREKQRRHLTSHPPKVRVLPQKEADELLARHHRETTASAVKPSRPVSLESLPCIHRGNFTGEIRECAGCGGGKRQKMFACALHGVCSIAKNVGAKVCAACGDRSPATEAQPPVRAVKWAYGVTTLPERRDTLLPNTLASLSAAGFDSPHLFVDGDIDSLAWQNRFDLPVTCHPRRLKVVGNWVLSLWELYVLNPSAERYAVFQDDILCVADLRSYLDHCRFPDNCYWNLYTAPSNESIRPRGESPVWYEASRLDHAALEKKDPYKLQTGRGALALVFNRDGVITLLSSKSLVEKPCSVLRPNTSIDGGIVTAMNLAGYREIVHYPSPTFHTGEERMVPKTVGKKSLPHPRNKSFPGDKFSAKTWIRKVS